MNPKQQAAQDLKHFALKLKGILALGDDLERLGQLEQTEQEIKGRISSVGAQEAQAKAKLAAALQAVQDAEAKANLSANQAHTAADSIVQKAKQDADAIVAEGKRVAERTISEANKIEMGLSASISDKRVALEALGKEITEKEGKLAALKAEMKALAGKLG